LKQLDKVLLTSGLVTLALVGLSVWPLLTQNGTLVLVYRVQGIDTSVPFTHVYLNVKSIIIHNPGNVYNPWGGNSLITDLWRNVNPPPKGTIDLAIAETRTLPLSQTTLPFGQYTQLVIMTNGGYSIGPSGNVIQQLRVPSEIYLLLGSPGKDANIAYQDAGIHLAVGHTTTVLLIFNVNESSLISNGTLVLSAQDQVITS
jgi:hypothetical protein